MGLIQFLKPILRRFLKIKVNLKIDDTLFSGKEPFVVVASHATRLDFLFLLAAFPKHNLKILAQTHNFAVKGLRYFSKIGGAILKNKVKGDFLAIKSIKNEADNNNNVVIFPTGMSSHSGASFEIPHNIAKLVKLLNVNVVTMRIDGGYLSVPPFKKGMRKGKVLITIKDVISKPQLKELSNDQIYDIINREIYFDDIEYQKINQIDLGKNRLGNIDRILWQCPKCKKPFSININNKENKVFCTECDYSVYYNKYGFFEGNEVIFDNTRDWYSFQIEQIKELKESDEVFSIEVERRVIDLNTAKSTDLSGGFLSYSKNEGLYFKNNTESIQYLLPNSKDITQIKLEELYVVKEDSEILFRPKEPNKLLTLFWLIRL